MTENEQEIADTKAEIAQLQEKLQGLRTKDKPSEEEIKRFKQLSKN